MNRCLAQLASNSVRWPEIRERFAKLDFDQAHARTAAQSRLTPFRQIARPEAGHRVNGQAGVGAFPNIGDSRSAGSPYRRHEGR
jgi:hypothetical protein